MVILIFIQQTFLSGYHVAGNLVHDKGTYMAKKISTHMILAIIINIPYVFAYFYHFGKHG